MCVCTLHATSFVMNHGNLIAKTTNTVRKDYVRRKKKTPSPRALVKSLTDSLQVEFDTCETKLQLLVQHGAYLPQSLTSPGFVSVILQPSQTDVHVCI